MPADSKTRRARQVTRIWMLWVSKRSGTCMLVEGFQRTPYLLCAKGHSDDILHTSYNKPQGLSPSWRVGLGRPLKGQKAQQMGIQARPQTLSRLSGGDLGLSKLMKSPQLRIKSQRLKKQNHKDIHHRIPDIKIKHVYTKKTTHSMTETKHTPHICQQADQIHEDNNNITEPKINK